jgi:hypothetical protein
VDLVSSTLSTFQSIAKPPDIKKAVFEMRKVLGEIPILASEQVSCVSPISGSS